jgi:diguanylate cyclase (GGDEF)-like protein
VQGFTHRLAGTGQTFGLAEVSGAARALEVELRARIEARGSARPVRKRVLAALEDIDRQLRADADEPPDAGESPSPPPDRKAVFLVQPDPVAAGDLAMQLAHFGYRVHTCGDFAAAARRLDHEVPAVAVIDLPPDGDGLGTAVLGSLREKRVPIVVVSAHADYASRLKAVRVGAVAYFARGVEVAALVDAIENLANPASNAPLRVLILDDDRELAEAYALELRNAGMSVVANVDPAEGLSSIADHRPDVVLLDLYLGDHDGAEVARVLRTDPANLGIPILFMSREDDRERQIEVLASGADDFLVKPISPPQLAREILARGPRLRAVQGRLTHDGLTGLLNHVAGRAELARELARARRERTRLAVAMIDLDFFKGVNDRHGHIVGDRVLRNLGWLLRRRLRRSDLVGRHGGEEFVVILPGSDAAAAAATVDDLRVAFAQLRHAGANAEIQCTFSAGVATFPEYGTAGAILDAADRALYAAKRRGRNRVEVAARK